ncbi:FHA modulated ABC efflux pump with fused ATPase and integral membrane subunits [Hyella patelloides LEGE 07179]|uniref:FHA modulated ABC efflux pump with fused ATPase and integral membrane subunits n=1 Tax=Hyella patelloides LEGE 07179 TaxID=945734 RepID=A0A563VKI4_9CYAN|nr:ATP-binding cassette domain-containing protein [Hyella patelloides]VEP11954.1 FHA modulated ABC efflux pump with fused ATPase and integral membrane subunits [Hyella patelloides LEGE 07179]
MTHSFSEQTVVSTNPFIELNNQGKITRFELTQKIHCLGRDPSWSNTAVPNNWNVISRRQAVIQKEGEDYRIYDGDRKKPSGNGIFIDHSRINLTQGYLLKNGAQLYIGQDPHYQITLTYVNQKSRSFATPSKRRLDLSGLQHWPVELGRSPHPSNYSSMQLDAPTVSRLHATIYPDNKGGHILQDNSTNGTFVNGKRVEKRHQLNRDDAIQIGPYSIIYTGKALELNNSANNIRLDAHKLCLRVRDKQNKEKTILNNLSLVIEPGQLVALVGGSGAGKSTLMKSLLRIAPLSSGVVYLNGDDLRQNWAMYRSQLGYVPQDDIIHRKLTVEEVLTYACKLRLPPDTDIQKEVINTLEQIKLSHVRHTLVSNLSGGQRKRVSIGVELLADPKLFFLDEPTSGLDPGLDKEMMQLLREQADRGRTIILVTHATGNIEVCDRIAFLGLGGNLCYFGPPREALSFFRMPETDFKYFADIYIELNQGTTTEEISHQVDIWSNRYRNSPQYTSYIRSTLSPGKQDQQSTDTTVKTGISPFKQLALLSQRYWKLVNRDFSSLIIALISGPITMVLTALSLGDEDPLALVENPDVTQASLALRLLFIFSCIAIWIGLSNSIQEIAKESAIYFRERLLNLGLIPYIGSKLFIRAWIALGQTLLMAIAVILVFKSPESDLIPWSLGFAITTFLTLVASTSLSLMISAWVDNANKGNSLLPLVMIPQIILSGVLFHLEGWSSKLSWLMLSRWSVGAYSAIADVNAMAPSVPNLEKIFEPSDVYSATWDNLALNWGILLAHTLAYLIVTLIVQKRKDIF